jgi:hypothetical protein
MKIQKAKVSRGELEKLKKNGMKNKKNGYLTKRSKIDPLIVYGLINFTYPSFTHMN